MYKELSEVLTEMQIPDLPSLKKHLLWCGGGAGVTLGMVTGIQAAFSHWLRTAFFLEANMLGVYLSTVRVEVGIMKVFVFTFVL